MRKHILLSVVSVFLLLFVCSCNLFEMKVVWEEDRDLSGFVLSTDGGSVDIFCAGKEGYNYRWYLDDALVCEDQTLTADPFAEPGLRHYTCRVTDSYDNVVEIRDYWLSYTGLPTVYINTKSGEKVSSRTEYVDADILIVSETGLESLNSDCTVKGRGNSSWVDHAKKGMNIKLPSKSKVLGMKKSKKWSLLPNDSDGSMLGNWFASYIGRNIFNSGSEWQPQYRFVNLVVNGDYAGCYVIAESIRIEGNRVDIPDISELTADPENDNNGDGKVDLYDGGFIMEFTFNGRGYTIGTKYGSDLSFKDPDLEEVEGSWSAKAIAEHVTKVVNTLEAALFGDINADYSDYLDVDSFIDWYLVNEFMGNWEAGFTTSTYFYFNPADGKIHMGPNWDFDKTIGFESEKIVTGREHNYWFTQLAKDPAFVTALKARWNEKKTELEGCLSQLVSQNGVISVAREMNARRWNRNEGDYGEYLVQWFNGKLQWMDSYLNSL